MDVSEHNSLFTSSLGLQRGCGSRYGAFQRRRSQSHSPAHGESKGREEEAKRSCVQKSPSFDAVKKKKKVDKSSLPLQKKFALSLLLDSFIPAASPQTCLC